MAYVAGFKHDIFLSYARVDNKAPSKRQGWIQQFHEHLLIRLEKRAGRIGAVSIWRDEEIAVNQIFDKTIQDALEKSAVFLAITSMGYLKSDYSRQELSTFYKKASSEPHGLSIGDRSRIINVLLYNIPPEQWPEEYGRTSGCAFHSATRPTDLGEPHDPEEKTFEDRLRKLTEDVFSVLEAFTTAVTAAPSNTSLTLVPKAATTQELILGVAEELNRAAPDPVRTVLLDFHLKDYADVVPLNNHLVRHGLVTLTGPDADGGNPRQSLELFEQRLKQAGTMVIPVGRVSEMWVRERVRTALQVIAAKDCPTRKILIYVVAPRVSPSSRASHYGSVVVRWIDAAAIAGRQADPMSELIREIGAAAS